MFRARRARVDRQGTSARTASAVSAPMRTPEQIEAMAPLEDRSAQRLPRLGDTQLEIVKRFANAQTRTYAPRAPMFQAGDRGVPSWFLLKGSAEVFGAMDCISRPRLPKAASSRFSRNH